MPFPTNTYGFGSSGGAPKAQTATPQAQPVQWKNFSFQSQDKLPVWQRDVRPNRATYENDKFGDAHFDYDWDRWAAYHFQNTPRQVMERTRDYTTQMGQEWRNQLAEKEWSDIDLWRMRAEKNGMNPDLVPYVHDETSYNRGMTYNPRVDTSAPTTSKLQGWWEGFGEGDYDARNRASQEASNFVTSTAHLPVAIPMMLEEAGRFAWYGPQKAYYWWKGDADKWLEKADAANDRWLDPNANAFYRTLNERNAAIQNSPELQPRFIPEDQQDAMNNIVAASWIPAYAARDYALFGGGLKPGAQSTWGSAVMTAAGSSMVHPTLYSKAMEWIDKGVGAVTTSTPWGKEKEQWWRKYHPEFYLDETAKIKQSLKGGIQPYQPAPVTWTTQ